MNKTFTIKMIGLLAMLLIMGARSQSQPVWKRFFQSPPYRSFPDNVAELYDKGYVFNGSFKNTNDVWYGWIVKTDINGFKLWEKIVDGHKNSDFICLDKTNDGGFIAGGRYDVGNRMDAYVMKFNTCAEPEWCSFFPDDAGNDSEIVNGIHQLPDGSYICERYLPIWQQHKRWSLIKIRPNGCLEWMNYYDLNTSWYAQIDINLILTHDNCFVVNGIVDDTIYGTSGYSTHPFWYKVDNNGNLVWEQKWELSASQFMGETRKTVEDKYGNYYSGGSMCAPYSFTYMYKLKHDGDTVASFRVNDFPNETLGLANTINIDRDTTLVLGTQFNWENSNYWALNLTDTLGIIRKSIHEKEQIIFLNSLITFDNKYLQLGITASDYPDHPSMAALYKFNSNLEYDSIYTAPRIYDSLCPHPIVSDTIPMPGICTLVSLPEPVNKSDVLQLKVYPNPASEYVTVEIPEFSVSTTKGGYITQQQFRPLSGEVQLSLINLSGQIVKTEAFDASERNHVIRVNTLTPGMYMLHLTQKGKFVAEGKVMVGR